MGVKLGKRKWQAGYESNEPKKKQPDFVDTRDVVRPRRQGRAEAH